MLGTGRLALVVPIGTTWSRTLTLWTDADQTDLQDLTGWTARMQARRKHSDESALFSLTSSPAAGVTLGATAGTIVLALTDAQTLQLPPIKNAVWDLELTDPDGNVYRLLEGSLDITPRVTQ